MSTIASLKSWSSGEVLTHTDLNSNFSEIRTTVNTYGMFTDVARTITAIQTFSAVPVFSAGATITTGGLTVSAGGLTVTGNSTITGTLGGVTTLTATTLAGTLSTAAQTNITSVGTLTALTVSGNLTLSAATSRLIGGATSFAVRNNANSADNLLVTDAGVVTVRSHLNVTGVIGGNGSSAVSIYSTTFTLQNSSGLITLGTAAGGTASTADLPKMPAVSGAFSGAVSDGAFGLDSTNHRFYVRSGGAWKYAALT